LLCSPIAEAAQASLETNRQQKAERMKSRAETCSLFLEPGVSGAWDVASTTRTRTRGFKMPRIPWTAILTHGPAIVAAAKQLLATAGTTSATQNLEARLQQLEKTSMESARLLEDIAQQIQALTIAQAQTARRAQIAVALGAAAVIMAIGVGILAFVR
jgi:hypothetical protein